MPYYHVKAVDDVGREVRKTIEAENDIQLLSFLDFLRLTPVKVSRRPEFLGRLQKVLHFRRIRRKDLIDLFENLHLLAQSGIPLGTGLWDLAEDTDNPAIRDMLQDVAFRIQGGQSISTAMARYEKVIGTIAVNLIRIGEETGNLDKIFKDISDHYRRIEDFVSKVKQALIYPAFALTAITIALVFWLVFVLPRLAELFKSLNVQLPGITLFVLGFSEFLQRNILFILLGFGVLVSVFLLARSKSERFRYVTDRAFLKIPIINMILYSFNYAFFSEYMRLMITAGVSLYDTLQTLENSFRNRVFKRAMGYIKEFVSGGGSISEGMKRAGVFPSLMVRMVAVGEETGGLDQQLDYLAQYYYNRLDYITQNIAKILEPVIIITVGGFMALIMVSLLLPIYDLISQIGRGA